MHRNKSSLALLVSLLALFTTGLRPQAAWSQAPISVKVPTTDNEITFRQIHALWKYSSTWADTIGDTCFKAGITCGRASVQPAMRMGPLDPAYSYSNYMPAWLLQRFKPEFDAGEVVLTAYAFRSGTMIRHTRIVIAGDGKSGRDSSLKDIRQYVKEVKEAPASDWVSAAEQPNEFIPDNIGTLTAYKSRTVAKVETTTKTEDIEMPLSRLKMSTVPKANVGAVPQEQERQPDLLTDGPGAVVD